MWLTQRSSWTRWMSRLTTPLTIPILLLALMLLLPCSRASGQSPTTISDGSTDYTQRELVLKIKGYQRIMAEASRRYAREQAARVDAVHKLVMCRGDLKACTAGTPAEDWIDRVPGWVWAVVGGAVVLAWGVGLSLGLAVGL